MAGMVDLNGFVVLFTCSNIYSLSGSGDTNDQPFKFPPDSRIDFLFCGAYHMQTRVNCKV